MIEPMSRLLDWLERKGRKTIIMDRDGIAPYLTRWYLIWPDGHNRKCKAIPFNAFIHRFEQSDEPVLHSHPWWFISVILRGGYWEHLPNGVCKWRKPGSIRFSWNCIHWIEVPEPGKTWTLFIRGRSRNNGAWGFINANGQYTPHNEYLSQHRKSS